jgi:hypothetical protein
MKGTTIETVHFLQVRSEGIDVQAEFQHLVFNEEAFLHCNEPLKLAKRNISSF